MSEHPAHTTASVVALAGPKQAPRSRRPQTVAPHVHVRAGGCYQAYIDGHDQAKSAWTIRNGEPRWAAVRMPQPGLDTGRRFVAGGPPTGAICGSGMEGPASARTCRMAKALQAGPRASTRSGLVRWTVVVAARAARRREQVRKMSAVAEHQGPGKHLYRGGPVVRARGRPGLSGRVRGAHAGLRHPCADRAGPRLLPAAPPAQQPARTAVLVTSAEANATVSPIHSGGILRTVPAEQAGRTTRRVPGPRT